MLYELNKTKRERGDDIIKYIRVIIQLYTYLSSSVFHTYNTRYPVTRSGSFIKYIYVRIMYIYI